jgi:hypothetical protein
MYLEYVYGAYGVAGMIILGITLMLICQHHSVCKRMKQFHDK